MNIALTEIQLTCSILMALLTLIISFMSPKYVDAGRDFVISRRLLITATIMATIHFLIQYLVHKNFAPSDATRTAINLAFGFPTSFFFSFSLIYLLRRGFIKTLEWLTVPVLSMLAGLLFVLSSVLNIRLETFLPYISAVYGATLLFETVLMVSEFYKIRRLQRLHRDSSYNILLKWNRWNIFLLSVTGIGFPFVIFIPDVMVRSIYGVVSITVAFVYTIGIMGYAINCDTINKETESLKLQLKKEGWDDARTKTRTRDAEGDENARMNEKLNAVRERADVFVANLGYTRQGLTIKDAAEQMDVSVNLLKSWLATTEYERFNVWIIRLRIDYAKLLLTQESSNTSDEIASKCGFCDRQYFQTLFRKYEGVTPAKWVKKD